MSKGLLAFALLVLSNVTIALNYLPHETKPRWSFEYHFGGVHNFKVPLTIVQQGHPDIYIHRAVFETEPFTGPHYWDWRLIKWFNFGGISFESIHQKIYLINKPAEVQRFGISHGYNMCIFNYHKSFRWMNLVLGGGSVLMHPESTIRGLKYPEGPGLDIYGYVLRGWVINTGVSHHVRLWKRFYMSTEAKFTFSQARAPIVDGYADVTNIAFQFIFGGGIDFGYQKEKK